MSLADSKPQLLMGLFGEGGTGNSHVVSAIRKSFKVRGMSDELLITATTGSAAVKISGQTLHSASLAARLIVDQPGSSATTTENHVAKPPLYTMILIPIAVGDCPLHCYVCAV